MPAKSHDKLTKNTAGFAAALALSRILGYLRDAVVVAVLGAGWLTDAFYAAFRLTNFFRRTVAEGAVNGAVMPALAANKNKEEAARFFSSLFTLALIAGIVLCVLFIIFARPIMYAVTAGFVQDDKLFGLTVLLSRILFPSVIFILLGSLLQGCLYLTLRFFVPAAAPIAFSVAVLCYLAAVYVWGGSLSGLQTVTGLAVSALIGSALQIFILAPLAKKEGFALKLSNPFKNPKVSAVLLMFVPALICSAGDQISMFLDMFFASFLKQGSVTAVYNATQIMQLPLAVFGASAAAGVLAHLLKNKMQNPRELVLRTIKSAGFILVPSAFALAVLSGDIVKFLFEHGKFTPAQTLVTAQALTFFALGLCAHGINKIIVNAFYSQNNWKFPLAAIILQVAADIGLCIALMPHLKLKGLAVASAVAAWGAALILFAGFFKGSLSAAFFEIARKYLVFAVFSAIMAGCLLSAKMFLGALSVFVYLPIIIIIGVTVYLGLSKVFKVREMIYVTGGNIND